MHSALCACGLGEVGYIRDIRKPGDAEACQFSGSGAEKMNLGLVATFSRLDYMVVTVVTVIMVLMVVNV